MRFSILLFISLFIFGCSSELDRCVDANTDKQNFIEKMKYAYEGNSKFIKLAEDEIEKGNKDQADLYVEKASQIAMDFYDGLNDIEKEINRCFEPKSGERIEIAEQCISLLVTTREKAIKVCNAQGIY